jgi:hypothetical protein
MPESLPFRRHGREADFAVQGIASQKQQIFVPEVIRPENAPVSQRAEWYTGGILDGGVMEGRGF